MITSNLPKNLMVEVENIVTLKHQAENSMNCIGVHNLQAPKHTWKRVKGACNRYNMNLQAHVQSIDAWQRVLFGQDIDSFRISQTCNTRKTFHTFQQDIMLQYARFFHDKSIRHNRILES